MFNEQDLFHSFGSEQAVEDGVLFDLTVLRPFWKTGLFNYVTLNLMNKGYIKKNVPCVANLVDLLNQALMILRAKSNGFNDFDYFFSGHIILPSEVNQEVFIVQNETGKFTIMLPEDY